MARTLREALPEVVHRAIQPVGDDEALVDWISQARFVLLGEASHGTHEFYRERARITQRLIETRGVLAVAAEADWPDAARVNRYVRGVGDDTSAAEALGDFRRFPSWMWRNTDVLEFVEWVRRYNDARAPSEAKVGFYGLDLYSLHASMEAVVTYLDRVDAEAAARARRRYACFDHFRNDGQAYGFLAGAGLSASCRDESIAQLVELSRMAAEARTRDGHLTADAVLDATQNARVVKDAEAYYRAMFRDDVSSWNLRDRHMVDTFQAILEHLERRDPSSRIVVWAHNSHLGDARATEMAERGELNVGQLVRGLHPRDTMLIGFTTHHGTVTAASDWDHPARQRTVRPALPGSYEALFHTAALPRFLLTWGSDDHVARALRGPRLERAIGVVYRPETERQSHYFNADLANQFDAILHFDETHAVHPLDRTTDWDTTEPAETYPSSV